MTASWRGSSVVVVFLLSITSTAHAQAQYGAMYQITSRLPRACSGSTATVDVVVKNTGTAIWYPNGNWLLGHHWDNGTSPLPPALYDDGTAVAITQQTAQGQKTTVHANLKFPAEGHYTLEFDMEKKGVTYFSQKGVPTGNMAVDVLSSVSCLDLGVNPNIGREIAETQQPPQLTDIFPFSVIQPGGGVIFKADHLGEVQGRFIMTLQNSGRSYDLQQVEWHNDSVGGTIPGDICGVPNQPASFQVIRPDGKLSTAPILPQFTANQDFQKLPFTDVSLVAPCALGTRELISSPPGGCCGPDYAGCSNHSIAGDNQDCTGFCSGTDKYGFSLNNGWVFDSWNTAGGVTFQPHMATGNPNGELDVSWSVQGIGSEPYWADLFITGPAGCPGNEHPWK